MACKRENQSANARFCWVGNTQQNLLGDRGIERKGRRAMATPPKGMDRRVQRTHQLLRQAAIETMNEKGFMAMTIQDIADRANVNRGTFYAHYPDKYALLDELIHDQFQSLLKKSLPAEPRWNKQTLHLLVKVVLEHFEDEYRQ